MALGLRATRGFIQTFVKQMLDLGKLQVCIKWVWTPGLLGQHLRHGSDANFMILQVKRVRKRIWWKSHLCNAS